jgi:hypothetical protein
MPIRQGYDSGLDRRDATITNVVLAEIHPRFPARRGDLSPGTCLGKERVLRTSLHPEDNFWLMPLTFGWVLRGRVYLPYNLYIYF